MNFVHTTRASTLVFALFISVLVLTPTLRVFAATSGPNSPSSLAGNITITNGDHNWSNASNATSSNNSHATVQITSSSNVSHYLRATGFGFSIPSGATINGITVGIERSEANTQDATIRDNVVSLVKNNVVVGQNKAATGTNWPTSDATANYGGVSDLWGTTWSRDDINNGNFGVVLSVGRTTGGDETARVDHITITVTYTVALSNQTITVTTSAPANAVYGATFPVAATASSALPVAITTTGGCSISGGTVTMTSGTTDCVVKYNQAGNASFNAAPEVTQTVDAQPRALTATADSKTKVYGAVNPTLTYQITSGTLVGTDTLSGALTRASGENVGTYAITQGTLAAGTNYALTFVGNSFEITKADAIVSVSGFSGAYDGLAHGASGTATGVHAEDLSASLSLGSTFTDVPGGTASWSFTGGTNYQDQSGTVAITITPRIVTVGADALSKVFGAVDPELTYTHSGNLVGTDAFTGGIVRAPGEDAGTYAITQGTLALTSNYTIAFTGADFTIEKIEGAIALSGLTHTYDGTAKSATVTSDFAYDVTYDGSATLPVNAGSYDVVATINDTNHTGTALGTLVISPVAIEVTIDDASKAFGAEDPAFTHSVTGGAFIGDDTFLTESLSREEGESLGTYAITGTFTASDNYALTVIPGTFTISTDPDNVSPLAEDQNLTVNEDSLENPVSLVASDENGASLDWTIVDEPDHGTLSGAGASRLYTPTADYFGADSFSFKVNDGNSDSNVATIAIFVNLLATCPEGYARDGEECVPQSFVPTCAEGTLNEATGECDFPPTVVGDPICPEGFFYVDNGLCMRVDGTIGDTPPVETAPATCETEGAVIAQVGDFDKCVIPTPSVDACPTGYAFIDGECVPGEEIANTELSCPLGYAREGIICLPVTMFDLAVTASGPGTISCAPGACLTSHAEGTSVTITATPDANASITEWSEEGCTGTSCVVHMNSDVTIAVTFACATGFHLEGEACVTDATGGSGSGSSGSSSSGGSSSGSGGGGGGGGGGGSRTTNPVPQVLGAATGTGSGGSCFQFTRTLSVGMTGNDVTELQKVLIAKGYLKINAPTGYFGLQTQAAVKALQAANGIDQLGIVDTATRALLNKNCMPSANPNQALIDELTKKLQALLEQIRQILAARGN